AHAAQRNVRWPHPSLVQFCATRLDRWRHLAHPAALLPTRLDAERCPYFKEGDRMMRVKTLAAAMVCLLGLACSKGGGGGPPDAGGTCSTSLDCLPLHDADGGTRPQVCITQKCTPTCASNAQCTGANVCEDGLCP